MDDNTGHIFLVFGHSILCRKFPGSLLAVACDVIKRSDGVVLASIHAFVHRHEFLLLPTWLSSGAAVFR